MTASRDPDRLIHAFLHEGLDELPDPVYDAVRDRIEQTRQRALIGPWRTPDVNRYLKIGLAAAAVVVIAVIGFQYLGGPNTGSPGASETPQPTATPTATPVPTPQILSDAVLEPGTAVATGLGPTESISVTFTVPDGWEGFDGSCVLPRTGTAAPDGMGICFLGLDAGLYSDPCHAAGSAVVPVGPTVEDLVNALTAQTAYESTTPVDVTLGGFSGKRIDLQLPSEVASCTDGEFQPWPGSIYAQGPDDRWHVWILDVNGERLIMVSRDFAATSAEDLAEKQAIVDSMRIAP
jgi:hypothetical protein